MSTSLSAGKAINAVLSAKLGDKVTQITPIVSTKDAKMPFVVYHRFSLQGEPTKGGRVFDSCGIEFGIYTKTYGEGIDIAEAIRETLEGKNICCKKETDGIDLRIDCGRMTDCDEGWSEYSYFQSLTIECKII